MTERINGLFMASSLNRIMSMSYTELHTTTNFSFLRGASHPEEMVEQAAAYGYSAIAITDRNTFAGIVRGHVAAKQSGIRFIPACRLDLLDGPSLLAFPTDINAYPQISNLLTVGNLRTEKGKCALYKRDVYQHAKGSKFIVLPPTSLNEVFEFDLQFKTVITGIPRCIRRSSVPGRSRARTVATMLSNYIASPNWQHNSTYRWWLPTMYITIILLRRELQDIVTCVREKCTIRNAGFAAPECRKTLETNR